MLMRSEKVTGAAIHSRWTKKGSKRQDRDAPAGALRRGKLALLG